MVQPKMDIFEESDIQLANIAKALSHPARVKILRLLNQADRCIVGDLVEALPLSQSTVSQHLKELKRAGLIRGEIEGPKTCYCLNPEIMTRTKTTFGKLFSEINCC